MSSSESMIYCEHIISMSLTGNAHPNEHPSVKDSLFADETIDIILIMEAILKSQSKYQEKSRVIFIIVIAMLVLQTVSLSAEEKDPLGTITFFIGDVQISHENEKDTVKAEIGQNVYPGDIISAGKESRAELTLHTGNIIRVDQNSQYQLLFQEGKEEDKGNKVVLRVTLGKLWVNLKNLIQTGQSIEIRSPDAVMAVRGTIARFDANKGSSLVYVYRGYVEVAATKKTDVSGKIEVKGVDGPTTVTGPHSVDGPYQVSREAWTEIIAGQMITIDADGKSNRQKFDTKAAGDGWAQWNKMRDATLSTDN